MALLQQIKYNVWKWIFSYIPEGCASILWRDQQIFRAASNKLANELLKMQIVDEVIQEPIGGAHRNKQEIISSKGFKKISWWI